MKKVFIDGSCHPQTKIGVGGYFYLNKELLKTKIFKNTSSTKLELENFLWLIKDINEKNLEIYTDCQNILSLLDRRDKLEKNNYFTKAGKKLNNFILYKEFYKLIDIYECTFIKIKGHVKQKNEIDLYFSKIDKLCRKKLREII